MQAYEGVSSYDEKVTSSHSWNASSSAYLSCRNILLSYGGTSDCSPWHPDGCSGGVAIDCSFVFLFGIYVESLRERSHHVAGEMLMCRVSVRLRNLNIAKQKTAESEHSRTVNYLLGGVIALFVVSSYLFFKRRAENALHVREADQRKINELADSYHELQMLRNVEREHYDLMIRKKEEGIKQQSAEIFDAKSHEQKITEKAILIQNSEIYQRFLTHLSTNPSGELTDKDWADLKDWIKKNFQTLYDYLFTINALSDKDCMICMLAFLYFSPSDIALLFDCSTPNISAARRRIVEKLTGRPGRAKDLDKILKSHF